MELMHIIHLNFLKQLFARFCLLTKNIEIDRFICIIDIYYYEETKMSHYIQMNYFLMSRLNVLH